MSDELKILVIEDSRADFLLLKRFLEQQEMKVELACVKSTEELEEALDEGGWRLVLLDYNVPGLDFQEAFQFIVSRAPGLPVILLSGSVGEERAVELLKMGVSDFVLKENMLRLPSAIEHCINQAAYRSESLAAAEALRESEERFRTIFTESRDALMVLCPKSGRFTSANPAALRMFGVLDEAAICLLTPADLSPSLQPDGRPSTEKSREMIAAAFETGGSLFEWQHRRLDGEEFAAEVLLSRVPMRGAVVLQATVRDVSLQKMTLEALQESEELNRQIIQNAEQGIVAYDTDLRYRVWNSYMERHSGLMAKQVIGRRPQELFPFLKEGGVVDQLEKVLAGGEVTTLRFPFYLPAKNYHGWASDTTSPLRNTAGQIIGAIGMVSDITERKRTMDSLRKLSTAVEQNPAVVMITDRNGVIEYTNPAFLTMTGYAPEEAVGLTPRILKGNTPAEVHRELWKTISSGGTWQGEMHNRRKDGSYFWERSIIAPVKDDAGEITNYLAIKEDITERRSLEEQLRQSQKMDALGQLAGGVAHDFNNIMQVISANAQLQVLKNDQLGIPCHHMQNIFEAVERGSSLTRSLLVFSRNQPLELFPFDLTKLVRETARVASCLLTAQIALKVEVTSDDLPVYGDTGLVQQVIFNLVTNARDAMAGGGEIILRVEREVVDATANGAGEGRAEYAVLSVQDSGCGVGDEIRERIFEPFFTTKPVGKGTGLGLAMVYSTVSQMNGKVTVESSPGAGATFRVKLPLSRKTGGGQLPFLASGELSGEGELILLAEDDPAVRASTEQILTSYGYRVIAVASGEEAIGVAAGEPSLQLAILDMIMPGLNGPETYQKLRELNSSLPVLFVSGHSDDVLESKGIAADRLQKPVRPMQLLLRVKRLLKGGE
ncbi:PAS domain S-box protein [Geomonas sp.]|uniref:PAS domain S-box protein n=1 Tax=Geomonas sp. TaxID=2651584 RepID=UPI002B47AC6B|nr:PAS domain S-box protein [Geomonas sp.]HJV36744.1 PAS domain S-box protein [Geomonas sp.]